MQLSHDEFLEKLKKEKRLHIFDFRESNHFAKEHIKGAINLPLATLRLASEQLYAPLKQEHIYVLADPLETVDVLNELEKKGFQQIHHVRGDINSLIEKLPSERKGGLLHEIRST